MPLRLSKILCPTLRKCGYFFALHTTSDSHCDSSHIPSEMMTAMTFNIESDKYHITGVPFYNKGDENEFRQKLETMLQLGH